jgi:NTP pyrophosphatase (non-canonical NTP hydrolase)
VVEELADVVITSWVLADMLKIDLDQAMSDKLTIIFNRGWKEK